MTRTLFDTTTINGLELANRLVRSATWEGLGSPDGTVNERVVDVYRTLAVGGVGLIITGYMAVRADGRQFASQLLVDDDRCVPGLTTLAGAVHEHSGKVVAQIVHCGGQADRRASGLDPVAPSAVASPGYPETPAELAPTDIEDLVRRFADAARRVKDAGFDGVQLHGAHGYLMSQFLSPSRNRRTDRWGGSLENRSRFAIDVVAAVRTEVGDDWPVMIKLNANDFLEGSTTENDAAFLAAKLAAARIDAIEVSGGTGGSGRLGAARSKIDAAADEAYFLPQAEVIRAAAPGVPIMLVGGMRSVERMESVLQSGAADYVSMSRPLIRQPDLPNRWAGGDRTRAACISCSGCFVPARKGEGIRCVQEK
ncbi:MAG: NADH:flavin oxidoreductase [Thermoanaerobaculales bacterium]|jgi:2,4-dienoyl-CoA reductase-like NADH-dependent reductase (Old Yellow Enzyme family)|nr:NADH:flavin oxidoreductase [Thermoanaerobaculales bacterium]